MAPLFLSPGWWVPVLYTATKDVPAPLQVILERKVGDIPLVVFSPYNPLRKAFLRMFGQ